MEYFDGLDAGPEHGSGNTYSASQIGIFKVWESQLSQSANSHLQTPQDLVLAATVNEPSNLALEHSSHHDLDPAEKPVKNFEELSEWLKTYNVQSDATPLDTLLESVLAAQTATDDSDAAPVEDFGVLPDPASFISPGDLTWSDDFIDDISWTIPSDIPPPRDTEDNANPAYLNCGPSATSQPLTTYNTENSAQSYLPLLTANEPDYYATPSDAFNAKAEDVVDIPGGSRPLRDENPAPHAAYSRHWGNDATLEQLPVSNGHLAQASTAPYQQVQRGFHTVGQQGMPPMRYGVSPMPGLQILHTPHADPLPMESSFVPAHWHVHHGNQYMAYDNPPSSYSDSTTDVQPVASTGNSLHRNLSTCGSQDTVITNGTDNEPPATSQPESLGNSKGLKIQVSAPTQLAELQKLFPNLSPDDYYAYSKPRSTRCPVRIQTADGWKECTSTIQFKNERAAKEHLGPCHFPDDVDWISSPIKAKVYNPQKKQSYEKVKNSGLPRKLVALCREFQCAWCDGKIGGRISSMGRHYESCKELEKLNESRAPKVTSGKRKEIDEDADANADADTPSHTKRARFH